MYCLVIYGMFARSSILSSHSEPAFTTLRLLVCLLHLLASNLIHKLDARENTDKHRKNEADV